MAYFHKDKNILHIGENENKYYTYDINTGTLIGLRGLPISRTPSIFNLLEAYGDTPMYYKNMITCIRCSCINHASALALFIDKYYAMPNHIPTSYTALKNLRKDTDNEDFFKKHFNKYMEYCVAHNEQVTAISYNHYLAALFLDKYKKYLIYNDELTVWQKELICTRLSLIDKEVPRLKKLVAKIMSHPNYWEYNLVIYHSWAKKFELLQDKHEEPQISAKMLNSFIDIYRLIPELPLIKANTVNEAYLQAQRLASSYIAEQETRNKELYKSYLDKIKYEDENFTMILPTTAEELQAEGKAQSNCVSGYYRFIKDMEKFIVFIRDKKNIDKPLITCDININEDKTLHINQYLLSHNYTVTVTVPTYDTFNKDISTEVRKNLLIFKENFQKHLDKITIM